MELPAILEYTNLLHIHGPDSPQTKQFITEHREDKVFVRRAQMVDRLFALKQATAPTDLEDSASE